MLPPTTLARPLLPSFGGGTGTPLGKRLELVRACVYVFRANGNSHTHGMKLHGMARGANEDEAGSSANATTPRLPARGWTLGQRRGAAPDTCVHARENPYHMLVNN
eukprot:7297193-Lingulodinium_polyedra.AAC.1